MIDPSTRLRRAIHLNNPALVKRITTSHPSHLQNPDYTDKSNTSLHLAASQGLVEIASHLLHAGHEGEEISLNTDRDTPLMLAARTGHLEVGRLLVRECPASIPLKNKAGLDALAITAQHPDSTALIPILLSHPTCPADPESRDHDGNTPLHHASASGSLKALRILLTAGANPLATNNYDWTPLAYSQTVAAEVYFKNLVAEFERRKVEGLRQEEERERQRAAGMRVIVDDDAVTPKKSAGGSAAQTPVEEDGDVDGALKRHWTSGQSGHSGTPGSSVRREWDGRTMHMRTRSGSGG